ncbi:MAG: 1,4-dihydroxy-6-naphthoate synthase [Bacteroidetes bacterium]|nr:MAG: 1,4-dihydroxy-6-naphthoate synthase [Bacteroidota bacterium]
MKIRIGFSPCPNDTFIFDALVHGKVDTEGLRFEPLLADVEELNRLAFEGALPLTKLSFHALGHLLDRYALLNSGSALGRGCGPLLIARPGQTLEQLENAPIAIPGRWTTANFLFSLAFPQLRNKVELLFSQIEEAVLEGEVGAGVIIHENRFTYAEKGLVALRDLGAFWEESTGLPIPLGGIAVRRDLPAELQHRLERVLRRSVEFALQNPMASESYVKKHAQEMDPAVLHSHIRLYVNDFTLDLGAEGRRAVERLFQTARELELIPPYASSVFIN